MDPNANLQEQERILTRRADAHDRARLRDLREALWGWLRGGGFEPRWSTCPRAAKHYREYGGSNVVHN